MTFLKLCILNDRNFLKNNNIIKILNEALDNNNLNFKFCYRSIHCIIKTKSTLLKLLNENLVYVLRLYDYGKNMRVRRLHNTL